jgi:Zn-dependent M28 family amino/carboxypeptidase
LKVLYLPQPAVLAEIILNNPYLEVDKKIVAEVYTSSETMDNLKVLCDVHGSRFPGLPGDKDAVDYIVGKFKEYGCENVHAEEFTIPGWTRGPATLEVVSPIKRSFDVISLPHSIGAEVEAELVFIGPGAIPDYDEEKIKGKILMVTSAKPAGMKRFFHRSEKYMRSIMAGAKGWIFMNHYPAYGPPTGGINPVIPAIGISHEDGSFLARLIEREGKVVARIKTTDKNVDTPTWNVIADVVPDNPVDDEYAVVGSHLDGHDISQGAVDPASGAVVVMEIARNLVKVKDKLKRRVRCMTFGAEEIGLNGSYYYASAHEEELDKCRFMLNLDAAGGAGKKGLNIHDFPAIAELVKKWEKEMVAEIPTKQGVSPYSDHWPFFLKSVPCASNSDPTATRTGRGYGHTRYDTLDKVDIKNLHLASANHTRILFRVANEDNWNPKRKTKQEIDDFIKEQGYDKTIALADEMRTYIKKNYKKIHPETKEWITRSGAW